MNRRQFLGRTAAAGTLIWTVPTIASRQPASAALRHSAAPRTPPPEQQTAGGEATGMGPPLPAGLPGTLPFTGGPEARDATIGAGAVLAGMALWGITVEARTIR